MRNYRTRGIFLLLGTNSGDLVNNLTIAKQQISGVVGEIRDVSSIYRTAAWGNKFQHDFLNQVVVIQTDVSPFELLDKLLEIELKMGRIRTEKWGPRVIDLDLIFYDQQIINTDSLTVPHPGIPNRRFTLVPLVEIAKDFIHPVFNKTIQQLLNECEDNSQVDLSPAS